MYVVKSYKKISCSSGVMFVLLRHCLECELLIVMSLCSLWLWPTYFNSNMGWVIFIRWRGYEQNILLLSKDNMAKFLIWLILIWRNYHTKLYEYSLYIWWWHIPIHDCQSPETTNVYMNTYSEYIYSPQLLLFALLYISVMQYFLFSPSDVRFFCRYKMNARITYIL